jgi:uncharacterized protein involved in exopolysaccharide biosynthesis
MSSAATEFSLREAFHVFFRHKGKAALFFVAVMLLDAVVTIFGGRSYQSEAKLLVRLGRENPAPDPMTTVGQESILSSPAQDAHDAEINSVAELLGSRMFIDKLVDTFTPDVILGLANYVPPGGSKPAETKPAAPVPARSTDSPSWWDRWIGALLSTHRDKAIKSLTKYLKVEPVLKSDVVVVTYEGSSAEFAQALVTKLLEMYMEHHGRLNRTLGAWEFLAKQTAELHAKLTQMESDLRDLQNSSGIISPERHGQKIADQIGTIESDLLEAEEDLSASKAQIESLRKKMGGLPQTDVTALTTGMEDKAIADMRAQVYGLELKLQQLLATSSPQYFEVAQVRQQIAEAKAILGAQKPTRAETTTGPDPNYQQGQLTLLREEPLLASLDAKTETYRAQLKELRGQLTAFNETNMRLKQLMREIEIQDASYRKYVGNLDQARIDEALAAERISSINVAQPATYESKPAHPRPIVNVGVGLFLGIFGGLGLAFFVEYKDRSLQTPDEVAQLLGLRVLAELPRLKGRRPGITEKVRR